MKFREFGKLIRVGVILVQFFWLKLGNLLRARLPFSKKRLSLQGIQEEVSIYRDQAGIPHIYARNRHDLYFAQGYVHAQDRFWQMEFWRHLGAGRLSEIVGTEALKTDTFIRTVGWNRIAQRLLAYYQTEAPEILAFLNAYCAGVNAYLSSKQRHFPLDMLLLRAFVGPWEIESWTALHSLTWGIVMADDLGENWQSELMRATLMRKLGETTLKKFFPTYPYAHRPVIVPQTHPEQTLDGQTPPTPIDWQRVNVATNGNPPPDGSVFGHGPGVGSGAWVINGRYTASTLPLLANDTHLSPQMPSIWYEIGLHTPHENVVGFSFAGLPGVVVGHNDAIAWAITNARIDEQDLYIEKINPDNPLQYDFQGQWHEMESISEVIKVRGGDDLTLQVRYTRHGPIISDVIEAQPDVLALQWTAAEPSRLLQALLLLNQAHEYTAFREALRYWDTPSQNFIYADTAGNIAYQLAGRVPLRQHFNGYVPVAGWTGEYEWQGWVAYEALPCVINPEAGYIVAANQAIVEPSYPHPLSVEWDPGDRAQRITDLLHMHMTRGQVTTADCMQMQMDTLSLLAASFHPLFANLSSSDPDVQAALEHLQTWSWCLQQDSVGATLFELFRFRLIHLLFDDDLGAESVDRLVTLSGFHQLADPASAWWENACARLGKSRDEMLVQALASTVDWCKEHLGNDMQQWQWGRLHTLTFINTPVGSGSNKFIQALLNRGPFPVDGGGSTVNAMGWNRKKPASVNNIPTMRMVIDLADLNASWAIHATGQSENPAHTHYDDMLHLWLHGKYHPMSFSRENIVQTARSLLILHSHSHA